MGILRLGEDVDAGTSPVWTHRCMEYRFLMESNGHIIAYLLSGLRDVSLELLRGSGRLAYSDENPEFIGGSGATLRANLIELHPQLGPLSTRQPYLLRARLGSGEAVTGGFALDVEAKVRVPHLGYHQEDYTVRYEPPAAGALPAHVSTAVGDAAKAWNDATEKVFPYTFICQELTATTDNCAGKNKDMQTMAIEVMDGEFGVTGLGNPNPPDPRTYNDCGSHAACLFFTHDDKHMRTMTMRIESPGWQYDGVHLRVLWTDDSRLHGTGDLLKGEVFYYLRSTVMHEFGHTFGLADLRHYSGFEDYLMHDGTNQESIPSKDIEYMRQVYRRHWDDPH